MAVLPPVPWDRPQTSYEWVDWYTKLRDVIDNSQLDHNNLNGLQGGASTERYHLTAAQLASLGTTSAGLAAHEADTSVHGISGDVVGTSDVQTMSNKTLFAAELTGTTNLSGGQLTFPVTQVPSASSNVLDDYREGTWTPTVTSQSGAITSYSATGWYTKIGRQVHATFEVLFTNAGTAGGGAIVTLPFAAGMFPVVGCGRETVNTGSALSCDTGPGTPTVVTVRTYNNASPIATNSYIMVSVSYAV